MASTIQTQAEYRKGASEDRFAHLGCISKGFCEKKINFNLFPAKVGYLGPGLQILGRICPEDQVPPTIVYYYALVRQSLTGILVACFNCADVSPPLQSNVQK